MYLPLLGQSCPWDKSLAALCARGVGTPLLEEAQLDWLGSSPSWHVSAGWLSSEQPCVGRIWRVSLQTPMGAEGGSAAWERCS